MLRFFGFIFLLMLFASGICLYVYRTPLAQYILSSAFHAEVLIDDVSIGWHKISFYGLRVPKAFFSVKRVTIEMPYSSFCNKEVEIDEITIEEPHLVPFIPKLPKSGSSRHFSIDKLVILNMHIPHVKPIPYIELHGIGKRSPILLESVMNEVMSKVVSSAKLPSLSLDALKEEAKRVLLEK